MSNSEFFETAYRMTYYLVAAISLFMLVPRLIKAKINIFCILWVVFSAFLMSSSYVSIATYLVPPMAKLMPPLSPAEQVNAIKGAAHAVAINALPSLFFWHGGAPYRELPEELVKTMPEDLAASLPAALTWWRSIPVLVSGKKPRGENSRK